MIARSLMDSTAFSGRGYFFILYFLAANTSSFCQFNDSTNYFASHTSAGIINRTNDGSSYLLNNTFRFNIYRKSVSLNSTNAWIYGKQKENLTNNDFVSAIDLNLFKGDRNIYYWGLGNFERSYSLKTNYRVQSGAGIGYYVIDKQNFVLQLSDGVLYEKSDLFDTESGNNDYQTIRNSFRIKLRIVVNNIITIDNSDFFQHAFADRKDYIIKSSTQLSLKLNKWLNFTTALNYNKLSKTASENLICNFGLTLEKYF